MEQQELKNRWGVTFVMDTLVIQKGECACVGTAENIWGCERSWFISAWKQWAMGVQNAKTERDASGNCILKTEVSSFCHWKSIAGSGSYCVPSYLFFFSLSIIFTPKEWLLPIYNRGSRSHRHWLAPQKMKHHLQTEMSFSLRLQLLHTTTVSFWDSCMMATVDQTVEHMLPSRPCTQPLATTTTPDPPLPPPLPSPPPLHHHHNLFVLSFLLFYHHHCHHHLLPFHPLLPHAALSPLYLSMETNEDKDRHVKPV